MVAVVAVDMGSGSGGAKCPEVGNGNSVLASTFADMSDVGGPFSCLFVSFIKSGLFPAVGDPKLIAPIFTTLPFPS